MTTRRFGWYRSVARPVFLALPPETSHGVVNALLGFPLPWRRLGGAATDPPAAFDLCGLRLRNPIGLAAGFDKDCRHLDNLGELGFGYVVGGTVTRAPRDGNPSPRIVRSPRQRSIVNSMGLPNPGADAVAATLRSAPRGPAPRLISVADENATDTVGCFELLEPLADGIELNASCPNVSWGRDRDNESHLHDLVTAFRDRTDKPLFVKLPPFVTPTEREVVLALAAMVRDAGADGLTCSNTRLVADARLAVGRGGLSGRALRPHTPRIVAEVRRTVGDGLAINACGGISAASDAVACIDAGATTVQIYSALIYEGPGVVGELTSALPRSERVLRGR
ncbi:MAG TPA: dihydroorotate dehydrogenase 2 [Actinomycetota bacterium]|nr:dihydroorotate dehydrogenase 2 [Actinomycetota bacterium]